MLVIVKRKGNRKEMTEVFGLMEGRSEACGLVLQDAQTGSAKIIAKYI